MEILIGILIFGTVVAVCRLWVGDAANSTEHAGSTQGSVNSALYSNSANTWVFDPVAQDPVDSAFVSDFAPAESSSSTTTPDCSADSSNDSATDCLCPVVTPSYDSGARPVDPGSSEGGSSN